MLLLLLVLPLRRLGRDWATEMDKAARARDGQKARQDQRTLSACHQDPQRMVQTSGESNLQVWLPASEFSCTPFILGYGTGSEAALGKGLCEGRGNQGTRDTGEQEVRAAGQDAWVPIPACRLLWKGLPFPPLPPVCRAPARLICLPASRPFHTLSGAED